MKTRELRQAWCLPKLIIIIAILFLQNIKMKLILSFLTAVSG